VDLTDSYREALPQSVLARYELRETRMAAKLLSATNPDEFSDIVSVIEGFTLSTADLISPGGNESKLAFRLNGAFRRLGWREARVDTRIGLDLVTQPWLEGGERGETVRSTQVLNEGYKVDNVKGRVALDVEWNAKDGNLDRDIGAYRTLYDAGLIDGAVMISRTHDDLRTLAVQLARESRMSLAEARKRLGTTTTTNYDKLMPRITRGDVGGCPFLAIFICGRTWERDALA
jgi:hypothetical protein